MRKLILTAGLISLITISAQNVLAQEQMVTIQVTGMTCGTCPISVRHRAMQMKGVRSASVDINTSLATVVYEDTQQSPQAIAQAITQLGYPARVTGANK